MILDLICNNERQYVSKKLYALEMGDVNFVLKAIFLDQEYTEKDIVNIKLTFSNDEVNNSNSETKIKTVHEETISLPSEFEIGEKLEWQKIKGTNLYNIKKHFSYITGEFISPTVKPDFVYIKIQFKSAYVINPVLEEEEDNKNFNKSINDQTFFTNFCLLTTITKTKKYPNPDNPSLGEKEYVSLNWRRQDKIGILCNNIVSNDDKINSSNLFCNSHNNFPECRCIQRYLYDDYIENLKKMSGHDYCWYPYCKNAYQYLILPEGNIQCPDNIICENVVSADNVTGDTQITANSLNCYINNEKDKPMAPTTATNNNGFSIEKFFQKPENVILLIMSIILLLIILFK